MEALLLTEKIIAVAVVLQTIELLFIKKSFSDNGVWTWRVLKEEFTIFPKAIRKLLESTLSYPNFCYLLILRLVCAVLLTIFSHPLILTFLLLSTVLICVRWRGVFNGGSDYMTIVILTALTVAAIFPDNYWVTFGALWYITIQVCSSYFVSGVVKLKRANWLSGRALPVFINSTIYKPLPISDKLIIFKVSSWLIIIFECSFPVALLHPNICLLFIVVAFLFHLINVYIFGLNRFLYAWASAYPALYFCSQSL